MALECWFQLAPLSQQMVGADAMGKENTFEKLKFVNTHPLFPYSRVGVHAEAHSNPVRNST